MSENFIAQCENTSMRSKFMRVRSLWNLCARAREHSLEGTLPTNHVIDRAGFELQGAFGTMWIFATSFC